MWSSLMSNSAAVVGSCIAVVSVVLTFDPFFVAALMVLVVELQIVVEQSYYPQAVPFLISCIMSILFIKC